MEPAREVVSLVNISTEKWPPRHRPYFGSLEVHSPELGQSFAVTPIRGCTSVMDMGDKRTIPIQISAREVAEDLARELNGDSGEGSFHGVFVAAGPEPTDSELADARRRLEEFQRRLVAAADLEWERTKNPMFITDLERRAARQLGLEKPWLYDPKPLVECPACGDKIKSGVAVCKSCNAILDREKAAQYGLVPNERKDRPRREPREARNVCAAGTSTPASAPPHDGAEKQILDVGKHSIESDSL